MFTEITCLPLCFSKYTDNKRCHDRVQICASIQGCVCVCVCILYCPTFWYTEIRTGFSFSTSERDRLQRLYNVSDISSGSWRGFWWLLRCQECRTARKLGKSNFGISSKGFVTQEDEEIRMENREIISYVLSIWYVVDGRKVAAAIKTKFYSSYNHRHYNMEVYYLPQYK